MPSNLWAIQVEPRAQPLATAATLGGVGWVSNVDYNFIFDMTAERLRMWVDGNLEAEISAPAGDPFSDGRFALYTHGQETSLFHDLTVEAADAGDAAQDLVAPFRQPVTLGGWTKEEYPRDDLGTAAWVLRSNNTRVDQFNNSRPSFFYSDFPLLYTRISGILRPAADDDFTGFALGFEPGDSTDPQADYLFLVWKGANEGTARQGLRLFRVRGIPSDFWNLDAAPELELLAEGVILGNAPWAGRYRLHLRF